MAEDWTEKYRPRTLAEVVGNNAAVKQLREWADEWEFGEPKKKALVLVGAPGIGKTSSALALANEYDWGIVELNASDVRSEDKIKKVVFRGAMTETFSDTGEYLSSAKGRRKLIVVDEADHLYERTGNSETSDRGGKKAIAEAVRLTSQPIIIIVNDYYGLIKGSGSSLKRNCLTVKFQHVRKPEIAKALSRICNNEGILVEHDVLYKIAEHSGGDMRSAVRDLQNIGVGRTELTMDALSILGFRDVKHTIFDSVRTIMKTTDFKKARNAAVKLDETPEFLILWIEENLPLEYTEIEDLVRGFDAVSRADIYLGMARMKQMWSLWSYANDMMSAGVALAKRQEYRRFVKYQFPSWLREMGASKKSRSLHKSLAEKIGSYCHSSKQETIEGILPYFSQIYQHNKRFRASISPKLRLDASDIAFLLEEDENSPAVERVLQEIEEFAEAGGESLEDFSGKDEPDNKPGSGDLFSFG
jgi:replication factor C large subunit